MTAADASLMDTKQKPDCLYCGRPADTRDHVPPKVLLQRPLPANVRTVPACGPCNRSWSLDEEYLAIVLAQIGTTPYLAAKAGEGGSVDRALMASPGLDERIIRSLSVDAGEVYFAPEFARVANVAEKIAWGLHALRYGPGSTRFAFKCIVVADASEHPPPALLSVLYVWPGNRTKRWTTVQDGVFSFLLAKSWMAGVAPLYCVMNLYETLLVAVSCPPPVSHRKERLSAPC